jgi:Predicted SAM-dependent RNA methyltransferase
VIGATITNELFNVGNCNVRLCYRSVAHSKPLVIPPEGAIEHMEEDEQDNVSSLPRWVLLEYSQMLKLAGKGSKVVFTHLSEASCIALDGALSGADSKDISEVRHDRLHHSVDLD